MTYVGMEIDHHYPCTSSMPFSIDQYRVPITLSPPASSGRRPQYRQCDQSSRRWLRKRGLLCRTFLQGSSRFATCPSNPRVRWCAVECRRASWLIFHRAIARKEIAGSVVSFRSLLDTPDYEE